MKILNHVIECNFRAKRAWTDPILARHEYWSHFVIGKFSLVFGQPHLEPITVCAECHGEIERVGEDLLDYCEACQSVEGKTVEMTMEEWEAVV